MKNRGYLPLLVVLGTLFFASCRNDKEQFTLLSANTTGLNFNPLAKKQHADDNEIKEIGNAVAVGDLNNDGLPDLVFGGIYGNLEIYYNRGGLQFENITNQANLSAAKNHNIFGTAIVDINNDGWNDLYTTVYIGDENNPKITDHNLLFVNNKNGSFTERSAEYGLDLSGNFNMPYFFDFDKDGDVDVYITNWPNFKFDPFDISYLNRIKNDTDGIHPLLLENRNNFFVEVTGACGIEKLPAVNNSCIITDINNDGWPDLYVTNDFIYPDKLYINHAGHFKNELGSYFSKTTMSSMGSDCADINNDMFPDIVVSEMLSAGHYRRKINTMVPTTGFFKELKEKSFPQYQRNVMQLNNAGLNFSEITYHSNISSTEWSWSPLLVDFDNDGFKDLFISAGTRKELFNLDHVSNFRNSSGLFDPTKQWLLDWRDIPSYQYHNYIFKNNDGLAFSDKTISWGLEKTTNSEGAAYADFDNDGDIDIAICNTNCAPFILRNNNNTLHPGKRYLRLALHSLNSYNYPIGTRVYLYAGNKRQLQEAANTKGYLSMSESVIHFGVDTFRQIDSVRIVWPSGRSQAFYHIITNKTLQVFEKNALDSFSRVPVPANSSIGWSTNTTTPFVHHEDDFDDFKRNKIIPHRVSREGPAIAVADIDNDGDLDYYISGAKNQAGALYIQNADGTFKPANSAIDNYINYDDETTAVWADIDGNGLPDLLTGIGSEAANDNDTAIYHMNIWLNYGGLNFERIYSLPSVKYPIGSISAGDFDNDGDIDLFVGCRIIPGSYGLAPESYLFENKGRYFDDVTNQVPGLRNIGMVTSSVFADLDGDKQPELIVAGEFLPISIFKKTGAKWVNNTTGAGLGKTNGLWNCISITDINKDGKPDILAGNWGDNSIWRASESEPLSLWVKDFDGNGSTDAILFHYLDGVNAPFVNRDLFCKQMPKFFNTYNNYESYARCTDKNIFDEQTRKNTNKLFAYTLQTSLFINDGFGHFKPKPLPAYFQLAPVKTFITYDFDKNGTTDILPLGNSNSNFYDQGDIDALRGKIFAGDGKGNFDEGVLVAALNKKYIVNSAAIIRTAANKPDILLTGLNNDTMQTFVIAKPAPLKLP